MHDSDLPTFWIISLPIIFKRTVLKSHIPGGSYELRKKVCACVCFLHVYGWLAGALAPIMEVQNTSHLDDSMYVLVRLAVATLAQPDLRASDLGVIGTVAWMTNDGLSGWFHPQQYTVKGSAAVSRSGGGGARA